jgi:sulfur-oxidizing protein SoxA
MKKTILMSIAMGIAASGLSFSASAEKIDPEFDRQKLVEFFKKRNPDISISDYKDGVNIYSENLREQFISDEEFPMYEDQVAKGEKLWKTPFANGKTYASCFRTKDVTKLKTLFPFYSETKGEVITLDKWINDCRVANGEKELGLTKGDMASITGYLAMKARGRTVHTKINGEGALAAYQNGKEVFYAKRGQFNMSCADCHVYNAGRNARSNTLSPAVGHVTHWPAYRKSWGELGTLQRRYKGCQESVRANAFKPGSKEFNNMEYFESYMSNGLEWNGPATRG